MQANTSDGSDDYIRAAKRIVRMATQSLLDALSVPGAYERVDEADAYEKLMAKLIKANMDKAKAGAETEKAKEQSRKVFASLLIYFEDVKEKNQGKEIEYARAPGQALEQLPSGKDDPEVEPDENTAKYVIAAARRNRPARTVTTLHSASGCWRARALAFSNYELVFEAVPPRAAYSDVCKNCWPGGPPDFNTEATGCDEDSDRSSSTSSASS